MKNRLFILIFLFVSGIIFSLPSIAVLDAVLSNGVDLSVQIPITEKIIEELVASCKYRVLDRGSILQVLEEKQFQLSGMVKDTEIKQAGEYLGADYVSVAKVSKVGNTYFISAKIINVESGEITIQTSHEKKGDIEVVLEIAKIVGRKLAGGEYKEEKPAVITTDKKPSVVKPAAPAKPSVYVPPKSKKPQPKPHTVVSYGYPIYSGTAGFYLSSEYDYDLYNIYSIADNYGSIFGYSTYDYCSSSSYAFDLHILQPVFGIVYISLGTAATIQTMSWEESDSYSEETAINFITADARACAGIAFPVSSAFQIFGGAGVGYQVLVFGDYWGSEYDVWTNDWEGDNAEGLAFCYEAGVDLFLGSFVISARLQGLSGEIVGEDRYTEESYYGEDGTDSYGENWTLGYIAFMIGAGIAY